MNEGRGVKDSVRAFYDDLGWKKRDAESYEDAARFEDLRNTSADYLRRCHHRVKQQLPAGGSFLLDVASGPLQSDDFLEYSEGYSYRVCVDLSLAALRGARERIGAKGLFALGDITRLPFREGAFDGIVSLHTIFHVPASEQANAFLELHRVLASEKTAVVVYSWGKHSPLMLPFDTVPHKLASMFRSLGKRLGVVAKGERRTLYFAPQSPRWFDREVARRIPVEVRIWRTLTPFFMKRFVPGNGLGRWFLSRVFELEERLPRVLGRWGAYPMIVIRKA